jgi:hypothetical protein
LIKIDRSELSFIFFGIGRRGPHFPIVALFPMEAEFKRALSGKPLNEAERCYDEKESQGEQDSASHAP